MFFMISVLDQAYRVYRPKTAFWRIRTHAHITYY
nr:MAG TPA: hypothetical protein [Caudoviricetes sp.]